jgi:hypothetical protein
MAESRLGQTRVPPAKGDPIRIVPVHPIEAVVAPAHGAPPPPPPQLTYRGGPLLSAVEVFTVSWGSAWTNSPEQVGAYTVQLEWSDRANACV